MKIKTLTLTLTLILVVSLVLLGDCASSPPTPSAALETPSPSISTTVQDTAPTPSPASEENSSTPSLTPSKEPTTSAPSLSPKPSSLLEQKEPLQYRELDSFTTEAVKDVIGRAVKRGYDLPMKIVVWDYFALYVVVQNLDNVSGMFKVHYTIATADKVAAEKQMLLHTRTPEEYAELNREYYEGTIELYLEPGKVGVSICPSDGIHIAPDRVPFDFKYEIIPDTKTITKR